MIRQRGRGTQTTEWNRNGVFDCSFSRRYRGIQLGQGWRQSIEINPHQLWQVSARGEATRMPTLATAV